MRSFDSEYRHGVCHLSFASVVIELGQSYSCFSQIRFHFLTSTDAFMSNPTKFYGFFTRVLHIMVSPLVDDLTSDELTLHVRRFLLVFMINAFQSLENPIVRSECMRLVSLSIWHCLANPSRREQQFKHYSPLKKMWNAIEKKFEGSDQATRKKMEFERSWLSVMLKEFIKILYTIPESEDGPAPTDSIRYCERFLEFLIDLEAQLPTRRHFNMLLDDHQVLILCKMAPIVKRKQGSNLFNQLLEILRFYAGFEINDHTGLALTDSQMTELHCGRLMELQLIAFKHFKNSLSDIALSNLASIERRPELLKQFKQLDDGDLVKLCDHLGIRSDLLVDVQGVDKRELLVEGLVQKFEKRTSQIEAINAMPLYPDEFTLFNDTLVKTQFYSGDTPLALPKLNLQFLTIHDYLLRNFNLFRLESTYQIRQDIEDVVKRLAPRLTYPDRKTEFSGWARMAVSIQNFSIVDVAKPNLGENKPAHVKADITFNLGRFTDSIKGEWDSLRQHDIMFLLTIQAHDASGDRYKDDTEFRQHFGLKYVRGCEIADLIGSDGKPIDEVGKPRIDDKNPKLGGSNRTLRVWLDPNQYKMDMDRYNRKEGEDVHETFNVLVRRKPKENNFKAVLETIRDLMQSDLVVPDWLQKVFLGYGDPGSAHYSKLSNRVKEINFRDTFLDWDHLRESFPEKKVVPTAKSDKILDPPYVVEFPESSSTEKQPERPKKRKVGGKVAENGSKKDNDDQLVVKTYTVPNMGPYPEDVPRKNSVKFTPVQAEAIHSGVNPGLTLVVGPPGTGKTDVAVQIIANLYHNFPDQHTLLVTHSNQALNQLFEKIMALDIDQRHLLRLGHGEEELNTEMSFSKYGRVNSFLERRLALLDEVGRLGKSLEIPGDHGYTCETAGYFYLYHVLSRWEPYIDKVRQAQSVDLLRDGFPFTEFFSNAPQPLFTPEMTFEEALDVVEGCFRHLKKTFTELEEIRAFELLRTGYDRANYLLTKEAKIIAMTCTHAALKRRELVGLNFKYDNIVMEEAAQILEVETFIPLLLQETEDGRSRLKRVIMIGDHNQLPPVVKNMAFQQYGNMEQSLFTRFVRLGVPTVDLDAQGRARSSIAKLYTWRYKKLGDLAIISQLDEYQKANAGFIYDYQLVNVGDYNGVGESEPVPYFYQNLGEAEYIVAVYQYMRLIGYPAEKITILTTYNGQKALIRDVLNRRCAWNPFFGRPAKVTTVDKYQGQQNDYILLSLVRTKSVGHIRDVRRLIVAMSRARLGLYVFCRRALFENCYELMPTFNKLVARPDKLQLKIGEMWPATREADDHGDPFEISDVAHMGAYAYQMMQEQLQYVKSQQAKAVIGPAQMDVDGETEGEIKAVPGEDEMNVDDTKRDEE
ncbi:P-loop containing nucleoside triphosphate hydrolase protein [Jimgerdemannia flammicorona]|uniref:Pre-mRNA-splicing factor n=1 Tax=Jimgerdemannia flammicorona TaxID=994334 RepID=A0A433QX11_9FUNG|nr:P-loop containing nucleoside triphosphate hydrolase protein [Jimgerdemannia flammicorona]